MMTNRRSEDTQSESDSERTQRNPAIEKIVNSWFDDNNEDNTTS